MVGFERSVVDDPEQASVTHRWTSALILPPLCLDIWSSAKPTWLPLLLARGFLRLLRLLPPQAIRHALEACVALTPSSHSVVVNSVAVGRSSGKCTLPAESYPQICRTPWSFQASCRRGCTSYRFWSTSSCLDNRKRWDRGFKISIIPSFLFQSFQRIL